MAVTVDCFGITDQGRVRHNNEDQFLVADLTKSMHVRQTSLSSDEHTRLFSAAHGKLFLVADGMGGVAGGEKASGVAVRTVAHYVLNIMPWFFRAQDGREAELEGELKTALEECQKKVEAAAANTRTDRMGTTLTMAYLLWPRLYVVHAGDSRCYLLRNGRLHRVTRDHTVAQQMIERGLMEPDEAERSRWSHVLWNCIGGGSHEINPEVYKAKLEPGDSLLLCTDGLSKYVADAEIGRLIERTVTAEEAAKALVEAANAAGGDDNITVVVAHLLPEGEQLTSAAAGSAGDTAVLRRA